MSKLNTTFQDMLVEELKDPEFARAYHLEGIRIQMIDDLINALDDARMLEGISKVELARSLQQEPANVRRFFTSKKRNPTMSSFIDLAISLGFKIKLEPLTKKEKQLISNPTPMRAHAG